VKGSELREQSKEIWSIDPDSYFSIFPATSIFGSSWRPARPGKHPSFIHSVGYLSRPVPWRSGTKRALPRPCKCRQALQHHWSGAPASHPGTLAPWPPAARTGVPIQLFWRVSQSSAGGPGPVNPYYCHPVKEDRLPPLSFRYLSSLVSLRTVSSVFRFYSRPSHPFVQH
jgi:hypothetical protein